MNTQNIKNVFMHVLYNSIVTFGKGLVWTIRFVTGTGKRSERASSWSIGGGTAIGGFHGDNGRGGSAFSLGSKNSIVRGGDAADARQVEATDAEWEAQVMRVREQYRVREAEKAAQQAEATRIRDQAIVDFKQACIEASAKGDVIVEVPEILVGTQFVAVPANDTKTVLTVVDGGAE
jgi:hypothetical protein